MPKTRAYYEIWLDEEKLVDKKDEADPLYEDRYMPRKFKIAIAIPPNNDVDVFANDIGLIAIIENNQLRGFNLAVGGGLSTTHGNKETYARLGTVIGFCESIRAHVNGLNRLARRYICDIDRQPRVRNRRASGSRLNRPTGKGVESIRQYRVLGCRRRWMPCSIWQKPREIRSLCSSAKRAFVWHAERQRKTHQFPQPSLRRRFQLRHHSTQRSIAKSRPQPAQRNIVDGIRVGPTSTCLHLTKPVCGLPHESIYFLPQQLAVHDNLLSEVEVRKGLVP